MFRKDFIKKKISLIQEELGKLVAFKDFTLEEVTSDFFKYNTLERLLEKIIMRAVDINQHIIGELANENTKAPANYRETFTEIAKFEIYPKEFGEKISRSAGTRNVLAHDYDDEGTDYEKIYYSVNDCLKEYHRYCEYILKFLKKNEKG
ncbi:MAG: DUF86 domain-containing protein [bacterium]|nr:DUF86 domain-containing protein [bacterium]